MNYPKITPIKIPVINSIYNKISHIGTSLNKTESEIATEVLQKIREIYNPYEPNTDSVSNAIQTVFSENKNKLIAQYGKFKGLSMTGNIEKYVTDIISQHCNNIQKNEHEFINLNEISEKILQTAIQRTDLEFCTNIHKKNAEKSGKKMSSQLERFCNKEWHKLNNKQLDYIKKRTAAIQYNKMKANELGITESYKFLFDV